MASNCEDDIENQKNRFANGQDASGVNDQEMETRKSTQDTNDIADQELLEKMAKGGATPKTKQPVRCSSFLTEKSYMTKMSNTYGRAWKSVTNDRIIKLLTSACIF